MEIHTYTPSALNQIDQIATNNGTPASFTFDADGNMTVGRVFISNAGQLAWNGENRLIETKTISTANPTRYAYDAGGRRVAKLRYDTSGNLLAATAYLYDDWNMVAEYNLISGAWQFARGYIWGLDLSNTLQGAGGVGGLLGVRITSAGASTGPAGNFHATCDGNGNIEAYVTASGALQAVFQYDAFGNHFSSSATPATGTSQNHFFHRFSSKYQDTETRFLYYGYRYYDPATGRWPSRDPIEEEGGMNMYCHNTNDSVRKIDLLGLYCKAVYFEFIREYESEDITSEVTAVFQSYAQGASTLHGFHGKLKGLLEKIPDIGKPKPAKSIPFPRIPAPDTVLKEFLTKSIKDSGKHTEDKAKILLYEWETVIEKVKGQLSNYNVKLIMTVECCDGSQKTASFGKNLLAGGAGWDTEKEAMTLENIQKAENLICNMLCGKSGEMTQSQLEEHKKRMNDRQKRKRS